MTAEGGCRLTFTFSALSPLTPASLAPVRKCHHLFAHARSAQSSELTRQSEYQCSARYKTAAERSRPQSSRQQSQNKILNTPYCQLAFQRSFDDHARRPTAQG